MRKPAVAIVWSIIASFTALAQSNLLGVHDCYGRGCQACHASIGTSGIGQRALWGQNLSPNYGQTVALDRLHTRAVVSMPANVSKFSASKDPVSGIVACLSCHDGNLARPVMTKGLSVEAAPPDGPNSGHPIGPGVMFGCGGGKHWDCSLSGRGEVSMSGPNSSRFAMNYGFPAALPQDGSAPMITCSTCHDVHSETVWAGNVGGVQASWRTSFFVRGSYTPGGSGNAASQFCRSCHAEQSNEMHGVMNVATTGISRL